MTRISPFERTQAQNLYRIYALSANNGIPTLPVPPVHAMPPLRAPGMRGKEQVERQSRVEAQYAEVLRRQIGLGRHLDVYV